MLVLFGRTSLCVLCSEDLESFAERRAVAGEYVRRNYAEKKKIIDYQSRRRKSWVVFANDLNHKAGNLRHKS